MSGNNIPPAIDKLFIYFMHALSSDNIVIAPFIILIQTVYFIIIFLDLILLSAGFSASLGIAQA